MRACVRHVCLFVMCVTCVQCDVRCLWYACAWILLLCQAAAEKNNNKQFGVQPYMCCLCVCCVSCVVCCLFCVTCVSHVCLNVRCRVCCVLCVVLPRVIIDNQSLSIWLNLISQSDPTNQMHKFDRFFSLLPSHLRPCAQVRC